MTRVASRRPGAEQAAEPEAGAGPSDGTGHAAATDGTEPDARFTFANERTFLAWNRTALALVVAGLAIAQLLPPFPGVPFGRHLLAVPLIALGAILSTVGYLEWRRNQRALRHGQPHPAHACHGSSPPRSPLWRSSRPCWCCSQRR